MNSAIHKNKIKKWQTVPIFTREFNGDGMDLWLPYQEQLEEKVDPRNGDFSRVSKSESSCVDYQNESVASCIFMPEKLKSGRDPGFQNVIPFVNTRIEYGSSGHSNYTSLVIRMFEHATEFWGVVRVH